jgi:predicted Zn-dependent protease
VLAFWWIYFDESSTAFRWQTLQQLQSIESVGKSFSVGLFEINMPVTSLVVFESQLGSDLQFNILVQYLFFACMAIGIFTLAAIVTTLKRFSFFVGTSLMILWVIGLNLESLQLFGLTNKIPTLIIICLVGAVGYYFQSFQSNASFLSRWLVFQLLGIVLCIVFLVGSNVSKPLLQISANSVMIGTVLSLLLIVFVSHEVIALFIDIVTNTKKPTKSAFHFYTISAVYLVNLFVSYLVKEGHLHINFWIINSFFLLTVSALLAIWGFQKREPLYADFLPSSAHAVIACLSLVMIAFSFLVLLVASANATLIEALEDVVLYSHLGYGLIFVVYVTANFSPMLLANLPVHKILYKPDTMPFFTFRAGAAIATFAFLSFASTWGSYIDQTYAAYYNAQGDLAWYKGETTAAEGYYKKSLVYRNQNHHAHYALGTLYTQQLDPAKARLELATAAENSPSEISYINLADIYAASGNYLAQTVVLQEGLKKLPGSSIIQNALGLAHVKLLSRDSALYYFNQSRQSTITKEAAETNLLGAAAKFQLRFPADSLLALLKSEKLSVQSNALALANVQSISLSLPYQLPKDTTLSVKEAVLMVNFLTNQGKKIDTALLKQIEILSRKPTNETFKDELQYAVAQCYYDWGISKKAGELLREVAYRSGTGNYFHQLGIWLLQQDNPATAARYFKIAAEKGVPNATWLQALSWLEADSIQKSLPLLVELSHQPDTTLAKRAEKIIMAIQSNSNIQAEGDEARSLFARYRIPITDSVTFNTMVNQISNHNIKASILLARSKKYFTLDNIQPCRNTLQQIKGLTLTDKKLFEQIQLFSLMVVAQQENWKALKQQLPAVNLVEYPTQKIYFEALLAEADGDHKNAKTKFDFLSKATVQSEEITYAAARYFLNDTTDRLKPYSIIVNGLLAKPNSIKLLKIYVKESAILGFEEESAEALEKLRKLMSPHTFNAYVRENPDFFEVE